MLASTYRLYACPRAFLPGILYTLVRRANSALKPEWWNGRHGGLKNLWGKPRASSTLASGTKYSAGPRIARPAFIVAPMPNHAHRKPAPCRTRRKPLTNGARSHRPRKPTPRRARTSRRPAATDADWSQPPEANPPIAGRGCVRVPSPSWCRHRGREADASSTESHPPHGAGSRAWRAYRHREDLSYPRYRQRWCHR